MDVGFVNRSTIIVLLLALGIIALLWMGPEENNTEEANMVFDGGIWRQAK